MSDLLVEDSLSENLDEETLRRIIASILSGEKSESEVPVYSPKSAYVGKVNQANQSEQNQSQFSSPLDSIQQIIKMFNGESGPSSMTQGGLQGTSLADFSTTSIAPEGMALGETGSILGSAPEGMSVGSSGELVSGSISSGSSAWGSLANPVTAIIAAATAAQLAASNNNDKVVEGIEMEGKDLINPWIDGDESKYPAVGQEPWLSWMTQFGDDKNYATSGDRFTAAVENEDWGKAVARGPAMLAHWADPGSSTLGELAGSYLGKDAKSVVNPVQWSLDKLGDFFFIGGINGST